MSARERRACGAALLTAVLVASLVSAAGATGTRHHRIRRPPAPLPHSLTVDEQEYSVRLSHTTVAAGKVVLSVYNRGMDPHDLVVQGPITSAGGGAVRAMTPTLIQPGTSMTLTIRLGPGTYKVYCSLYSGTPMSHDMLGMHAHLNVK